MRIKRKIGPIGLMSPIRPIRPMGPIRPIGPIGLMGLIGLIGLIGLTGCSGDSGGEEVPPTTVEQPITFSGELFEEDVNQDNQAQSRYDLAQQDDQRQDDTALTRADQPLSDQTHTFHVWGYKNDGYEGGNYTSYQQVFPGYQVDWTANTAHTTTTNTHNWEYVGIGSDPEEQTIKYWDWAALAYRFFGATNWGGEDNGTYEPNKTYGPHETYGTHEPHEPHETYTLSASVSADNVDAAPYFSELWFSTGSPVDYPDKQFGQPVKLRFVKPFARVRFLFTFAEDLHSTRADMAHIRFLPNTPQTIARAGIVSVAYPLKGTATEARWSTSNTTGISAFTIDWYEDPGTPASDHDPETYPNSPCHWYTVLPADAQGDYAVEMSLVTSEIRRAVVPAQYMRWQAGYQYTYQFKVTTGGGIVFDRIQIGINEWTEAQGGNKQHTVYNW